VDNFNQQPADVTHAYQEPCAKCQGTAGFLFVACMTVRGRTEIVTSTGPFPAEVWTNTIPCPCGAGRHASNTDGTPRHGYSRGRLEYLSQFCFSHPDHADSFAAECRRMLREAEADANEAPL
jgi:hypothetical protein